MFELDEELGDIQLNLQRYVAGKREIPDNSILFDYELDHKPVSDTLPESYFLTVKRFIPIKAGTREFRQLHFTIKNLGKYYEVTIEKQIEGKQMMARNIIKLSLITILCVVIVLMMINRMVFKRLWRPFYDTLSVMRNFHLNKKSDLDFPESDIEEFNYMNNILKTASLKAGEDYIALKEFTENASHELQTPLSIISSKLDLLIQDEHLSERQNHTIISAYTALKKMSQLNQSLLLLAKIGNQQYTFVEKITLPERFEEKIEQFKEIWQDQELRIITSISESYIVMNSDLNDILINNLLSNAAKHNIQGGFIQIILSSGFLSISNSGTNGPLDKNKLYKRFYKSDQSSSSNGLGLSIIKQICEVSEVTVTYVFENKTHKFILVWPT